METPCDAAHRCSVLVVDDEPEVREVVRVALTTSGYDVLTAATGRDAMHVLRSTATTCIIVLDLMLPGMDAAQFRAVQLRDRSLGWIPIVVLSAAVDGEEQARAIGARSFVRKPLDVDALRRALAKIGCRRGRMPRAAVPADAPQGSTSSPTTDELAGPEPPG